MKGEKRDPMMVWLLIFVTCGLYSLYWFYTIGMELKTYLQDESLNPAVDMIILIVCGFYGFYLPIKYGAFIQRAQQKAGIADAKNNGVLFLLLSFLCGYGYVKMQEELNRTWETA